MKLRFEGFFTIVVSIMLCVALSQTVQLAQLRRQVSQEMSRVRIVAEQRVELLSAVEITMSDTGDWVDKTFC